MVISSTLRLSSCTRRALRRLCLCTGVQSVYCAQNQLLPDHQPDLVIQERDGGEGDDAQHDKPGNNNEHYFSILLKVVKTIDLF